MVTMAALVEERVEVKSAVEVKLEAATAEVDEVVAAMEPGTSEAVWAAVREVVMAAGRAAVATEGLESACTHHSQGTLPKRHPRHRGRGSRAKIRRSRSRQSQRRMFQC